MARLPWQVRVRDAGSDPHERSAPAALLELARGGPAALAPGGARLADSAGPLSIATIVPPFRRGSGGHATIMQILVELRRRGHEVSVWLEDGEGRHARESPAVTARSFAEFFAGGERDPRLRTDFAAWRGADVVLATGWQTVARALLLADVGARAYLVQDHEPDFYGSSSEALWAERTYSQGLHCICASPWLAQLLRERYGATTSHFDLGVDHDVYEPGSSARERELVVFYARAVTPRRAVPLGLLALEELARRRPTVEIALFGESSPVAAPFAHRDLGVLPAARLAELYSRASVGMVLSLTNPSLIGLEMMAAGLPCVELASPSMLATFGADGPLALAAPDPLALCEAIERLLDDPRLRERAVAAGLELAAKRTWAAAAEQVERGLRAAVSSPAPVPRSGPR